MPVALRRSEKRFLDSCPMVPSLHFLGQKWMLPLLVEFFSSSKPQRFADLQRALYPITPKMLSARLKELVKEGYVKRKSSSKRGLESVSYRLTPKSRSLRFLVREVKKWCAQSSSFRKTCKNCASYPQCRRVFG